MRPQPVTSRNAAFQQWQALLTNRTKRTRLGELLVQGVRPVTVALDVGWPLVAVLHDDRPTPSAWARESVERAVAAGARPYRLSASLLAELADKGDVDDATTPEVVLVAQLPPDDVGRLPVGPDLLTVVLDRPSSPGNVGSSTRSLDAFGGTGLVVCGHATDPYDPRAVRASTGSTFALPTVRLDAPGQVLAWAATVRERLGGLAVVGTDESGDLELADADLTGPTVVVTGNETRGLSAAWRDAVDVMVHIPMGGTASSLNAANATTVVLYEAARQRRAAARG